MSEEKIEDAEVQAMADAEVLQNAIIHGHLQPAELATALAALQRQSLTTIRLLAIVGEGKFVTHKELSPWKAGAYTLGGAILAVATAVASGKLS